jgi:general secretion pathway protein E
LPEVVDALVADGLIPKGVGEAFKKERRYFKGDIHPLVVIADQKWKTHCRAAQGARPWNT